jgi:hypothetical protein
MRVDQIGTSEAEALTFPHSVSNANRALRTLSRILRFAVDKKALRVAPRIKLRNEHGRTALLESSTDALLLKHAPQPLADVLVVMMDCGMRLRPNEIMRNAEGAHFVGPFGRAGSLWKEHQLETICST